MAATNCRHFNGYKPCGKIDSLKQACSSECAAFDVPGTRVLLIHLGALGAVVRSTSLLPALRRKYPRAHVTWVTDAPGDVLLREHPLVDRVIAATADGIVALRALDFDVALVVDKSLKATGVLRSTSAREVFGFVANPATGAIEPATPAAREAWELGLSNHLKFNVNQKSETQLMHEALELGPWYRDSYSLYLSETEQAEAARRRRAWSEDGNRSIIGVNTGCAATIAYKKLSVEGHVALLHEMRKTNSSSRAGREPVYLLLGGKEDKERNRSIASLARSLGISIIESGTEAGLRDGMISVSACDVIVSGDSLGLHMALGFEKPVVAWFGPTCAHEIDLYGGAAILTKAPCSPCWKRSCSQPMMCYDQVDFQEMARAVSVQLSRRPAPKSIGAAGLEIAADL